MTTIATNGITIAADSRCVSNGWAYDCVKLWKLKNEQLFASCGTRQDAFLAKEYFEGASNKPKLSDNFSGLLIKGGKVHRVESALIPFEVPAPHAIGSGRDFALMGMAMGLSPHQAITKIIEMNFDIDTGGYVTSFEISK